MAGSRLRVLLAGNSRSTLMGLLDSRDERLKRLTTNDVVNHFLRHKELHELETRIEAIEAERARPTVAAQPVCQSVVTIR